MTTHIVSFSGGRTSAYLVHLMEEKRKVEDINVKYVFCDTGAEHPLTYKFIKDVVNYYGIDLICLRAVIPPTLGEGVTYKIVNINDIGFDLSIWQQFMEKYSTPSVRTPICTDRLKKTPFDKWLKTIDGEHITWLGIRSDEPRRLRERERVCYLAEISDFDKQDVLDFWKEMPFDLELKHECLGNCVFCVKKSVGKIALAERYEPEIFNQFNTVLYGQNVRIKDTYPHDQMYWGNNTPKSIIAMFKDHTTEEIEQTIRSKKQTDSGSCSESCEAIFAHNLEELLKDY